MSFVSPAFLIFLAVAFLCYFISPRRARWVVLLASSYVFYWIAGGLFAICAISGTALTVYAAGLWTGSLRKRNAGRFYRRLPLVLCLTINFGVLLFFKYSFYFAPSWGLLLIPGISFYTFQAVGYLIDIYRGKVEPEKNPFKMALFLSFFPQLIQGPISRHSEIAADLFAGHGWNFENSRKGMQRIIWGYFIKLVVADRAAVIVDAVFSDYNSYGGAVIIFAMLVYSIQIYADFAGGINITLGIGEILGIKLPENFRQPFFANSLADFWRRWHITLSAWLKDYLFYPIALSKPLGKLGKLTRRLFGNRIGKMLPTCLATFAVYLVMGVWHGSGVNVFIFGILNGLIISTALLMEPQIELLRSKTGIRGDKKGFGRTFAVLRTLALFIFLRYFARAATYSDAIGMLKQTVFHPRIYEIWNGTILGLGLSGWNCIVLFIGVLVMLVRDIISERGKDCRVVLNNMRPALQFVILVAVLMSITLFGIYSDSALSATFIYAQY